MTTTVPELVEQSRLNPDRVSVDPHHLSITEHFGERSHNIHLLENGDIGVVLARGQEGRQLATPIAHDADTGSLVITLGVDGDHDQVHFSACPGIDPEELLGQAIEALHTCRQALIRVRKA